MKKEALASTNKKKAQPRLEVIADFTSEEIKAFHHWAERNEGKIVSSKKYYKAQKNMLLRDVRKLFEEKPGLPFKDVIITILSPLPSFLPAQNIVEVVAIIAEEWERLSIPVESS